MLTKFSFEPAVQLQPFCVVTLTLPVPPAALKLWLEGVIENVQLGIGVGVAVGVGVGVGVVPAGLKQLL